MMWYGMAVSLEPATAVDLMTAVGISSDCYHIKQNLILANNHQHQL